MRNTMAALAGRYVPMGILVAENALQFCMFARTADQCIGQIAVAGTAIFIRFVLAVCNI